MTERAIHPHLAVALLREVLQSAGYRAEEGKDGDNAPLLRSATGGLGFEVRFANPLPDQAGAFADAALRAAFHVQGDLPLSLVNRWNASRRFAHLSLSGDLLLLEMDVVALGGVTADNLRAHVEIWERLVNQLIAWLRAELPKLAKVAPVAESAARDADPSGSGAATAEAAAAPSSAA